MGARGFCVGIGEFLTFSAMVLMILVNIGQISSNVVARNFSLTHLATNGINTAGTTGSLYANSQSAPLLQGQGIRYDYYWGMYSVCGGLGKTADRACSSNTFGNRFMPVMTLTQDAPQNANIGNLLPQGVFQDDSYLGRFTNAAFYLLFIGTILAGLAFLFGVLANRFAFLFAALLSLGAAACLAAGVAIWTALIARIRNTLDQNGLGLTVDYGVSIWMAWAAFGATALAFPFLVISCCAGRDKY